VLAEFAPDLTIWLVDTSEPNRAVRIELAALFPAPFVFRGKGPAPGPPRRRG